jgi:flagellar basal body-associated protein FliL
MEPTKKNKPHIAIVILFSLIVLMVVAYLILVTFFPAVFCGLNTSEIQPVNDR